MNDPGVPGWRGPDEVTRAHHSPLPPLEFVPLAPLQRFAVRSLGRLGGWTGSGRVSLHTTVCIHSTEHVIRVSIIFARRARSRWMRVDEGPSPASSSPGRAEYSALRCPLILSRTGAKHSMVFESFHAQARSKGPALPMVPRPPRSVSV